MRTNPKHSASFDTYQVIKRLVAKGIEETQAEEIVDAILEGRNTDLSQLVTKEQFLEMQKDIALLKKDFEGLRREMATKSDIEKINTSIEKINTSIEKTKIQLIVWLGGFIVAAASIIISFLQFFYR